MKFIKKDSLSISECCELLNIKKENLPDALQKINEPKDIIDIFKNLLYEDKKAFESCSTIEEYKKYIAKWPDGLHKDKATQKISQLKEEAEELACYRKNKNNISGLEYYIKRYPNGKYLKGAKSNLKSKIAARKIRNRILCAIVIVFAIIISSMNYSSVSYLYVSEEVSFGKRGGDKTITISTDANTVNLDVSSIYDNDSLDWINVNLNNDSLSISTLPNSSDEKVAIITLNTYSTFFGYKFDNISKKIVVKQNSGLATFLNTNISEVHFDKFGKTTAGLVIAETDGCNLQVSSTESWFVASYNIEEDDENIIASITLSSTGVNNEGDKTGELVISCNDYIKHIKVSQASGLATDFRVAQESLIMEEAGSGEGMCYPIDVYTDGTSWSVHSSPEWLTAYADLVDKRLEIKVGPNYNETQKGIITLKSNNGHFIDINVTQEGDPTNFCASKDIVVFGESDNYEYITIYNDSKKSIYVEEYESWLSATTVSKNKIKISCDRNYKDPPRDGNVYVECGNKRIAITIVQDGWENCSRCGGFKELDCPNLNVLPWTTEFGVYTYMWDNNGRHILRRGYTEWNPYGGPPIPKTTDSECLKCKGDGKIECPKCNGKGKTKKIY